MMVNAQDTVDGPLLKEDEAAALLSVSIRTLQSWRCSGAGPAFVRAGRAVRYRRSDLIAWIAANVIQPTEEQGR